jgi:hypothetical protein
VNKTTLRYDDKAMAARREPPPRVAPLARLAGEAIEVAVEGAEFSVVFDRERRQVGVSAPAPIHPLRQRSDPLR